MPVLTLDWVLHTGPTPADDTAVAKLDFNQVGSSSSWLYFEILKGNAIFTSTKKEDFGTLRCRPVIFLFSLARERHFWRHFGFITKLPSQLWISPKLVKRICYKFSKVYDYPCCLDKGLCEHPASLTKTFCGLPLVKGVSECLLKSHVSSPPRGCFGQSISVIFTGSMK